MHATSEAVKRLLRDRYLIEREIGHGGMAVIHLARDLRHDRPVALKLLRPEVAATVGPERFLREIRLAARLQHPHILPVFDSGEEGGILWYAMPYVQGESLRALLKRIEHVQIEVAARISREIALALDYAHRQGVVHRDIKPENIMLAEGQALVADFGVALPMESGLTDRVTETGLVVGTPSYMSPEQASGAPIDGRADIYGLGCVLYEMLAGKAPFTGPTRQAVIRGRLSYPPPPLRLLRPEISRALDEVVARALSLAPADRFSTAAEFANAIVDAVGDLPCREPAQTTDRVSLALRGGSAQSGNRDFAIAVLPFVNLSRDRANKYLSDGMTEELINVLARHGGPRVVAHTSTFSIKRQNLDVCKLGRRLRVAVILEGSIRVVGARLRVAVQLIDVTNGYHLWAESYDRQLDDILSVQEELAQLIAGKVEERVAAIRKRPPRDYGSITGRAAQRMNCFKESRTMSTGTAVVRR